MSGQYPYLYKSGSEEQMSHRADQADLILRSLDQVAAAPEQSMIGLTAEGIELITWLMDLGAAPDRYTPSDLLRTLGSSKPMIMFVVTPGVAGEMRDLVRRGLDRHLAGATDPSSFRIH